ncbi:hypothetical protein RGQ13_15135 [Thalassotalea psychrophila]|uniref:Terminase small subunit n=1 Tax=Thalassotalea psychrophila TaxID=3065647 RepID=A0ABY9TRK3_9GAMM|nr:hypothetical protein RGQ13_15135 [Colwelliaceae bacterium SQ149]
MTDSINLATKLNPKQKLFAELCAKGKIQSEAYELAGYKCDNSTQQTINNAAKRCMRNVPVKTYYKSLLESSSAKAFEELSYTKQDWLRNQFKLLELAFGDGQVHKVASFNGEFIEAQVKETDLGAAIRIQEQLGKMLALFVDKSEIGGAMTITNLIAEISKEAGESTNDSPLPRDDD